MTVNFVYISFMIIVVILVAVGIYFSLSMAYKKALKKDMEVKTDKIYDSFKSLLEGKEDGDGGEMAYLKTKLSKTSDLRAFYYGYDRYVSEHGYSLELKKALDEIIDVDKLMKTSLFGKNYEKSYILYLLAEFRLTKDRVIKIALDSLDDDSVYVRNNALKVISGNDKIDSMFEAIDIMKGNSKYFNDRITIDFLDSFAGDKQELESAILKRIDTYDYRHKELFIEHLINRENDSEEVRDKLLNLFKASENIGLLIKISKYFGKMVDPRAEEEIINNLAHEDWRLRAVSARNIASYPSPRAVEELKKTVGDRNYYVRRNSARALYEMLPKEEFFKQAYSSEDNYSRQALYYIIEKDDPQGFLEYQKRVEIDEEAEVLW